MASIMRTIMPNLETMIRSEHVKHKQKTKMKMTTKRSMTKTLTCTYLTITAYDNEPIICDDPMMSAPPLLTIIPNNSDDLLSCQHPFNEICDKIGISIDTINACKKLRDNVSCTTQPICQLFGHDGHTRPTSH